MIKDITAYQINGEYYLHKGRPNANTKKKIKRIIQENEKAKKRGETQKTIHSHSFINDW